MGREKTEAQGHSWKGSEEKAWQEVRVLGLGRLGGPEEGKSFG
jgi:hypothetical protein